VERGGILHPSSLDICEMRARILLDKRSAKVVMVAMPSVFCLQIYYHCTQILAYEEAAEQRKLLERSDCHPASPAVLFSEGQDSPPR
jgi:hypothetical protein